MVILVRIWVESSDTETGNVEVYSQGMASIYKIIVDTQTGVNYLITFNAACGSGMTVLLDAEGKPIVTPMREAQN